MKTTHRTILIPIDGSSSSLLSLDYLALMFGPDAPLRVVLFYVLPDLPLIFSGEEDMHPRDRNRLKDVAQKNLEVGKRILKDAQASAFEKGFRSENVEAMFAERRKGVVQDIHDLAAGRSIDTILLTRRGRTEARSDVMGEVSRKLVEVGRLNPIWIIGGKIRSRGVLVAVDASENSHRAVMHVGQMLSGTDCRVTVFHCTMQLGRFVPREIFKDIPGINELWRKKSKEEVAPFLEKAKRTLVGCGLSEEQVHSKVISDSRSASDDLLEEAQVGDYGTIVVGRRGLSMMNEFFMGSVSRKVLQQASETAVWIVQ